MRPTQDGGGGGDTGLYGAKSGVVKLTSANFPGKSDSHAWLLEFYAPWCGHCKQLAPVWGKAANKLANIVKVGAVNCDVEKELCQKHG
jgi:thioredoxin-like negative regulator of GroEL